MYKELADKKIKKKDIGIYKEEEKIRNLQIKTKLTDRRKDTRKKRTKEEDEETSEKKLNTKEATSRSERTSFIAAFPLYH